MSALQDLVFKPVLLAVGYATLQLGIKWNSLDLFGAL